MRSTKAFDEEVVKVTTGWEEKFYMILRDFLLSDWFHFDNFLNFSPFIVGKQP